MISKITEGIEVNVEIFYQPEYSNPFKQEFMFAYRITIENLNNFSVQLLNRHWQIFDSTGEYKEVEGEGVVGLKPIIKNGETFQYVSGCNLKTEMGKMLGHYEFVNLNTMQSLFVKIPEFQLIAPTKNN